MTRGNDGGTPASVPTGNGTTWWSEGWRLFTKSPGIWIGIVLLYCLILIVLSVIPLLGKIAPTLLAPVFAGGVLLGCRELDRGGELRIGHLFAGFSEKLGPLVIVGVLYFIGTLIIVLVVGCILVAIVGMSAVSAVWSAEPMNIGFDVLATWGIGAMVAILVGLLVAVPLAMAWWFAPALVALRNDEPWAAMKTSYNACLVNMMPMFIYGLLGLAFSIIASIPLMLGWLVLIPVLAASVYASYKDIFGNG